ncbi:MAG: methyltransferase type 11 [Nitrospirales bacterium]|nr:MAG: methyltransferase type 11 [Nitrospirales bacterium]
MAMRLTPTRRTIQSYEAQHEIYLHEWNARQYKVPLHLHNLIARVPKAGLILDVGCGPGQDTRYLRRQGFHVCGADLTWSFLQAAKARAPRLPVVQADMRRLPFPLQTFDGIWAAASIIHLPKVQARTLLRKLFKLTKPGGWLALTVMYGREVGVPRQQWIAGRYLAKWFKRELRHAVQTAAWDVCSIERVTHQERKGAWINVLATRSGREKNCLVVRQVSGRDGGVRRTRS